MSIENLVFMLTSYSPSRYRILKYRLRQDSYLGKPSAFGADAYLDLFIGNSKPVKYTGGVLITNCDPLYDNLP